MQVHPTSTFARNRMGQPCGKFEAYYILGCREGVEPYLWLGFQRPPSRCQWRAIIETQDLERMEQCFERIPVRPGEMWMVPGGIPHAIGEGLLVLELMEASDLVVRCEFERPGMVVPPQGRYMGRDLEFCLDVFDYREFSAEAVRRAFQLAPEMVAKGSYGTVERWIGPDQTPVFQGYRVQQVGLFEIRMNPRLMLWVQTRGTSRLEQGGESLELSRGQCAWVAATAGGLRSECASGSAEAVWVVPGDWETGLEVIG
jgi:mannose-6-phosphate isomerase